MVLIGSASPRRFQWVPQHMFLSRNKKNIYLIPCLIQRCGIHTTLFPDLSTHNIADLILMLQSFLESCSKKKKKWAENICRYRHFVFWIIFCVKSATEHCFKIKTIYHSFFSLAIDCEAESSQVKWNILAFCNIE